MAVHRRGSHLGRQGTVSGWSPDAGGTKVAGRRFAWSCEITHWDPPRLFGYVAKGVGDNRHEMAVRFGLEPVADGCRLTMAGGGELPGRIAGIAAPLFVRLIMHENRTALKKLKSLAEQSPPSSS